MFLSLDWGWDPVVRIFRNGTPPSGWGELVERDVTSPNDRRSVYYFWWSLLFCLTSTDHRMTYCIRYRHEFKRDLQNSKYVGSRICDSLGKADRYLDSSREAIFLVCEQHSADFVRNLWNIYIRSIYYIFTVTNILVPAVYIYICHIPHSNIHEIDDNNNNNKKERDDSAAATTTTATADLVADSIRHTRMDGTSLTASTTIITIILIILIRHS